MSDARIQSAVDEGMRAARRALNNPGLSPIILEMDGTRFGACHWCESPIRPGNLFCDIDKEDPFHSCSAEWEHERQRKKDLGR